MYAKSLRELRYWTERVTTSSNHGQSDVTKYIPVICYIYYDKTEKIDSKEEIISFPSNLYFLAVFTQCHQVTNSNNFKLAKEYITFSYSDTDILFTVTVYHVLNSILNRTINIRSLNLANYSSNSSSSGKTW